MVGFDGGGVGDVCGFVSIDEISKNVLIIEGVPDIK